MNIPCTVFSYAEFLYLWASKRRILNGNSWMYAIGSSSRLQNYKREATNAHLLCKNHLTAYADFVL
jgi:hypothetical protein